ncbi:MAG TPA: adenosylhomocysteinase, partial [Candidatus Paceibacterota bacterium]
KKLSKNVHILPKEVDEKIGALKLKALGINIDTLTPEQKKYLSSWDEGTS